MNYNPPAGKAPDASVEVLTSLMTAALYRLNSDYNPVSFTNLLTYSDKPIISISKMANETC